MYHTSYSYRRELLTVLSSFQQLKFFIAFQKTEEVSETPSISTSMFLLRLKFCWILQSHKDHFCPLGRVEFTAKLMKLKLQDPSLGQVPSGVSRGTLTLCSQCPFVFILKRAPQILKLPAPRNRALEFCPMPPSPTEPQYSSQYFPDGKRLLPSTVGPFCSRGIRWVPQPQIVPNPIYIHCVFSSTYL